MQFYKQRDFGLLISDTFNFFKFYGKNYFINYLAINGTLILMLVVLYVVGYKSIFAQIFSSNIENQSYYFQEYFQQNTVIMIVFGLLFLLLGLTCIFLIYTFPVFYLKRLSETGDPNITTTQLIADFKKNIWKFIKFVLGMFLIMLPLTAMLLTVSVLLMFVIIGFFLLILLFPAIANAVNLTLFDYFNSDRGFFGSFSYGFRSQFSYSNARLKSPFWKYWSSSLVMYIIVQTVSSVILFIPMIIMGVSVFTAPSGNQAESVGNFFGSTMGIVYFVFYAVSILCSIILMNVNYINAGLIYYDSRLDLHQNQDFNEIENIGAYEM